MWGTVSAKGGEGGDTISFESSAGFDGGFASAEGGAGDDKISFGDYAAVYSGDVTADGGAGADTISFGHGAGSNGGSITIDLGAADSAADELIFRGSVENATVLNWEQALDLVDVLDPTQFAGFDNGFDTTFTFGCQAITFIGITGVSIEDFLF